MNNNDQLKSTEQDQRSGEVKYETPRIETVTGQELEEIVLNVNAATGPLFP